MPNQTVVIPNSKIMVLFNTTNKKQRNVVSACFFILPRQPTKQFEQRKKKYFSFILTRSIWNLIEVLHRFVMLYVFIKHISQLKLRLKILSLLFFRQ